METVTEKGKLWGWFPHLYFVRAGVICVIQLGPLKLSKVGAIYGMGLFNRLLFQWGGR
ncbi:hypothetical protein VL2_gp100 [Pseudomonas phage vB_PaeM_VL12]|uniref:Uncharacterized protein n=10 Tax=Nankokuvirus TaxID=1925779 RepID=A0A218L412_9CAUD|nr:hypothetical protein [Pseudomonas aeruginosa]YP_004306805.1 hypothetical protein KPP10_gp056 [Pseudomonas phage KPP10]YP_008857694.1 hypothetical protein PAK_P30059 [Pseudomonas phage PAK_P3]YP_009206071.1 hypothetical protein AVT15_gp095 [Pseudomonas phage vB_PaeM_PS24]YP_009604737.1 hypothetical protein FDH93_gp110 [Pseudomonas phage vB_PaeM_G1]ADX32067.1 hypothetical protein P3_CHA0059 [Pseudomonas phage P3_CHA]QEM40985.1 hypothetical protein PAPJP_059 [Pseudomonas phage PAP-JP]QIQ6396